MGRIVSNFFISLDGVVEAPDQWHFPYFDDEMGAVVGAGMETTGAFLLGRKLYDEWSEYWTANADAAGGFGAWINNLPKYVVTHRPIEDAVWNNTKVITEDHVAAIEAAKDATDGDIGMSGCATTVRWLLANNLLDELALLMHPIAVGHGQHLFVETGFDELGGPVPLKLVHSSTLSSGVLHLRYTPAGPAA
jgi:dihydrofolate reductase